MILMFPVDKIVIFMRAIGTPHVGLRAERLRDPHDPEEPAEFTMNVPRHKLKEFVSSIDGTGDLAVQVIDARGQVRQTTVRDYCAEP